MIVRLVKLLLVESVIEVVVVVVELRLWLVYVDSVVASLCSKLPSHGYPYEVTSLLHDVVLTVVVCGCMPVTCTGLL